MERRDPTAQESFNKMGGRGEMTKTPVNLQELRRRIYVKAKTESAGSGGVDEGCTNSLDSLIIIESDATFDRRKRPQRDRSHNP